MKTNVQLVILLFLILIPISTQAVTGPYNAGFVSGLWYSKTPFFAGETIRIYTAFQNHSGGDITGAVEFFDNDASIGEANFSAINDRLVETWIDWTVSYGNHAISAKIVEAQRSEAGKPAEKIEVLASESKPEAVFADKDSDKDGIGDLIDPTPLPPPPPPVMSVVETLKKPARNASPASNASRSDSGWQSDAGGENITTPDNQTPSFLGNITNTINGYAGNILQAVNTQRQIVKSEINNIDDMRKRIDTDHDGLVGLTDFNILMVNWGKKGLNIADYNQDGIVDIIDFNILMVYWS